MLTAVAASLASAVLITAGAQATHDLTPKTRDPRCAALAAAIDTTLRSASQIHSPIMFRRASRTRASGRQFTLVQTAQSGLRLLPGTDATAWVDHIERSATSTRHCLTQLRQAVVLAAADRQLAAAGVSPDTSELEVADFAPLQRRHARVSWMVVASAVGLSIDGRRAIVLVEAVCNGWCGFGQYVSLERQRDGRWRAIAIAGVWDN